MSKHCRRTFLKTASRGTVFVTAGGLVGSVQAEETVSVSGEVVTADGNPATDVTMEASTNSHPRTLTDSNGRFSLDVSANSRFYLGLYEYKVDSSPPERDGIPFIYDFGEEWVDESDKDLGTLTLPETYVVNLRFLHADGEPAPSTEPDLAAKKGGHWFGAGPSKTKVTRDGYLKIDGNDEPGVELGGSVLLSAEFDETGAKYEKSFNITEPTDLVVQAGKGFREASANTTEESTTTTAMKTTPTSTTKETTATTSTTSRSPTTSTVTNSPTSRPTEQRSETPTNTTQRPKRGFFSNSESANGNPGVLKDPFFLTVSGFVLSVGGIVHQMVRGS